MEADPSTVFRFRDFELDVAAFQLRRKSVPLHLEPRALELFLLLASRRGQLVTRQDIVERLWPKNVIIDFDTGLNVLVRKVRQVLQDSAEAPSFIETIPGKGYRFVAPVEERRGSRPYRCTTAARYLRGHLPRSRSSVLQWPWFGVPSGRVRRASPSLYCLSRI